MSIMKRRIANGVLILAVAVLVLGLGAPAYATQGTQSDPFITLSYLTGVFKPQVMNDVKNAEQEMTKKFEDRIKALEDQLKSGGGGGQPATDTADRFHVVTLSRGQTLACSVGAEIMLRVGTANGVGTAPALVNYTSGTTLASGAALASNHMYLVTIEGNGVKATSETARLLVKGDYKVS